MEFFLAGLGVVAVLIGLYFWWARRLDAEIAEGAEIEWNRLQASDPALLEGIDRARFNAIYRRVNFPRFPGYALACFASFVVSLPASFALLVGGLVAAEALGMTPDAAEIADKYLVEDGRMKLLRAAPSEAALYYVRDLGGFYYFFGVIFIWLLIVAFFMHRYHARRPGYLRDEILRTR
jgi:hypothetical protein